MWTDRHDKANSCISQISRSHYVCTCLTILFGRDSALQTGVTSEAVSPASFEGAVTPRSVVADQ